MFENAPSLRQICQFAIQKNTELLKIIINEKVSINFFEGLFSPVKSRM